jgi:hypothetical protein
MHNAKNTPAGLVSLQVSLWQWVMCASGTLFNHRMSVSPGRTQFSSSRFLFCQLASFQHLHDPEVHRVEAEATYDSH